MASVLVCVLAGAWVGSASGQLVYDNGVGGPAGVTTGLISDSGVPQAAADNVAIQPDQAVTRIEWTGFYGGGDGVPAAEDNFIISIRSAAPAGGPEGTPAGVLAEFPVGNGVNRTAVPPGTGPIANAYTYSAAISFTFLSGVEYWIEIENDNAARDDDNWSWGTGATGTAGSAWFSADLGATWFDSGFPGADFRLFDDSSTPCLADVNENGVADPGDFTAWIAAFNAGDLAGDQNENGVLDPGDFTAWVANYNAGC